jgi:hypothetical protein
MTSTVPTTQAKVVSIVRNVLKLRCNFCSKELPVHRVHQIQQAQIICDYCLDWHNKALDFLAGGPIPGCQICDRSWAILRDQTKSVEVRLYVVPRDGIYQVHCASCMAEYVPKRGDLYAGTPFGHDKLGI